MNFVELGSTFFDISLVGCCFVLYFFFYCNSRRTTAHLLNTFGKKLSLINKLATAATPISPSARKNTAFSACM